MPVFDSFQRSLEPNACLHALRSATYSAFLRVPRAYAHSENNTAVANAFIALVYSGGCQTLTCYVLSLHIIVA